MKGLRDLDLEPYKGITALQGKFIPTGIPTVDYALNDLAPAQTTIILGRTNCGKTTFVRQVIVNAINTGNKVFIVNGEEEPERFLNNLYKCVIGRREDNYDLVKINKRYHKEPKEKVLKALREWHKGKLAMFNKTDAEAALYSTDELFTMIRKQIETNKPDLIIIDNLMSTLVSTAAELLEKQSDFIQRCHDIAIVYKIHIVIVMHPNKMHREGMDLVLEDASGTSNMYNKIDNFIGIARENNKEKTDLGINGYMYVLKNKCYSDLIKVELHYDSDTGLLLEIDSERNEYISYRFNLDDFMDDDRSLPFDL